MNNTKNNKIVILLETILDKIEIYARKKGFENDQKRLYRMKLEEISASQDKIHIDFPEYPAKLTDFEPPELFPTNEFENAIKSNKNHSAGFKVIVNEKEIGEDEFSDLNDISISEIKIQLPNRKIFCLKDVVEVLDAEIESTNEESYSSSCLDDSEEEYVKVMRCGEMCKTFTKKKIHSKIFNIELILLRLLKEHQRNNKIQSNITDTKGFTEKNTEKTHNNKFKPINDFNDFNIFNDLQENINPNLNTQTFPTFPTIDELSKPKPTEKLKFNFTKSFFQEDIFAEIEEKPKSFSSNLELKFPSCFNKVNQVTQNYKSSLVKSKILPRRPQVQLPNREVIKISDFKMRMRLENENNQDQDEMSDTDTDIIIVESEEGLGN